MDTQSKSASVPPDRRAPPEGAVAATAASAHAAIERVAEAAGPAVKHLSSEAHHLIDRLAGTVEDAGSSLEARGQGLAAAGARLGSECRDYVDRKPLAAIGLALAAGFLLSRLMSRT